VDKKRPIGVCDSGVGGTSVVRQLLKVMPDEQIVYFGDTARMPYGPRPKAEIIQFLEEVLEFFQTHNVKMGIIACGTMTSQALELVRHKYSFPLVGVNTGAGSALAATRNGKIGVIATQGTVASGYHAKQITAMDPDASVFPQACPRFVPLVEAGCLDGAEVQDACRTYLLPLKESGVDTLILGCTHYPYLEKAIAEVMGPDVALIDPALETAAEAKTVLESLDMLNMERGKPEHQFFFSKNPHEVHLLVQKLMGLQLPAFRHASFEGVY
jgi:glutamate racemase